MADSIELNMFFNKHKETLETLFTFLDAHPDAIENLCYRVRHLHEAEFPECYCNQGEIDV